MQTIELRTARANDRIALRGVRLRARIAGMAQRTIIEQTFVNLEPVAIEAIYTFPLPDGAAVCGFEVITGDRVLTGTIEEANAAVEKYEEAISEGHGAFLVEQERPDVFTARVGNIKPRQAATIRLTYVCALDRVDRQIRIAFPTTLAPRFVTSTGTDKLEAMMDGDALNPPHVFDVPYGLSIDVEVDLGRNLRGVHSPSHALQIDRGDEDASAWRVRFAGGISEMNRDVILTIDLAREHEPAVQVEAASNGDSYLAVTFVPESDEDELVSTAGKSTDTVFVLDCSGSMHGDSIGQAVSALELCLRSMSQGDTFNICRFGSNFEMFRSEPVVYSQHTLDAAIAYVRRGADLGGTELYPPLEAIFKTKAKTGTVRQIILLTDGHVSNEPAVIELARKHRPQNRIFTFGIGAASSAYLVRGLARATGGAAEFISAGERIDEKVLRTFGRLTSPPVTDISIDWDGRDVQTLAEIPPVFDGDVLAVFGRTQGKIPSKVTLACQTPAGPKRWTVPVLANGAKAVPDRVIATMWARRMIQSMEDINATQRTRATAEPKSREEETLIHLSKQFGLLCGLTTFIAIEHRSVEERNEGMPALRRVPVMIEAGSAIGGNAASFASYMPASMPDGGAVKRRASIRLGGTVRSIFSAKKSRGADSAVASSSAAPAPAQVPALDVDTDFRSSGPKVMRVEKPTGFAPQTHEGLASILGQQGADGSFAASANWDQLDYSADLNRWRQRIDEAIPKQGSTERQKIVDTLLAIVLLHEQFASQRDLWKRAYRKACNDFLPSALGVSSNDLGSWLDELRSQISAEKSTAVSK